MAAVDRGAPRRIASLEGIVRMVGAICWNNDRVEQAVVLFIPSIMSSHLFLLLLYHHPSTKC